MRNDEEKEELPERKRTKVKRRTIENINIQEGKRPNDERKMEMATMK